MRMRGISNRVRALERKVRINEEPTFLCIVEMLEPELYAKIEPYIDDHLDTFVEESDIYSNNISNLKMCEINEPEAVEFLEWLTNKGMLPPESLDEHECNNK